MFAMMSVAGLTLMERTMTAPGTAATDLIVPPTGVDMQMQGTRRIVHAVLVVAANSAHDLCF
jgi:hypothetical protein